MAFTAQAPWPSRELSETAMRQVVLSQIADKACWRIEKYLGSMLYMDFGGEIGVSSVRQGTILQGEAMLGIRDCYWALSRDGQLLVDSESINDNNACEKLNCVKGAFVHDFVVHKALTTDFVFSNNVALSLDTTNRYSTDSDIAELVVPDGKIYVIRPDGKLFLSDEVSKARFAP